MWSTEAADNIISTGGGWGEQATDNTNSQWEMNNNNEQQNNNFNTDGGQRGRGGRGGRGRGRGGRGGGRGGRGGGQMGIEQNNGDVQQRDTNASSGWGQAEQTTEVSGGGGWGDQQQQQDINTLDGNQDRRERKGQQQGDKIHPIKSDGWERIPPVIRKLVKQNDDVQPSVVDLTIEEEQQQQQQEAQKKNIELITLDDTSNSQATLELECKDKLEQLIHQFSLNCSPYLSEQLDDCKCCVKWQKKSLRLKFDQILQLTKNQATVTINNLCDGLVLVCNSEIIHSNQKEVSLLNSILENSKLSLVYGDQKSLEIRVSHSEQEAQLNLNIYLYQSYLDDQYIEII